jgi:hypothetical protein
VDTALGTNFLLSLAHGRRPREHDDHHRGEHDDHLDDDDDDAALPVLRSRRREVQPVGGEPEQSVRGELRQPVGPDAALQSGQYQCADPAAVDDPEHLVGYSLLQTAPQFVPVRGVHVTNALGTFVVDVLRPTLLFVPSAKSLTSPPPPLASADLSDHFSCYLVRGQTANATSVTIEDEFGMKAEKILNLEQLCVPVDKNGEGISNPALKLACYKTRYIGPSFRGLSSVFVNNQFGPATLPQVSHGKELCLPSS